MITIPGKIPIRIYPFFWLLVLFIGWMSSNTVIGTVIWAFVIFFSVLIHEYGHALTAVAFGQKAHIELVGLGGVTVRHGPRQKLWKEFIIILNGPLAGFLLYLFASQFRYVLETDASDLVKYAIFITIIANLFWTVVNLLPIHPLDGGKLLSIMLEAIFGMRGVRAGLIISSFLAISVSIYFFAQQSLLGGALFILLAFESFQAWKNSRYLSHHDQNESYRNALKAAEENIKSGHDEVAIQQLDKIRAEVSEGAIYLVATEKQAKLYNSHKRFDEAYELLRPIRYQLSPETLRLMHQLAFQKGLLQEAVDLGKEVYQVFPGYEVALTNALAYAQLAEEKPAVGWLRRAIQDGLPNLRLMLDRPEFNAIRSSGPFQELQNSFRS